MAVLRFCLLTARISLPVARFWDFSSVVWWTLWAWVMYIGVPAFILYGISKQLYLK